MMVARTPAVVFLFAFLAAVISPNVAFADTSVDADIIEDMVWTKEGSPYLVQVWLIVDPDVTLTIDPGVVVQFGSDGRMDILGRLQAHGTADEPIRFTSQDGSRWGGVRFENQEVASSLDHVAIRYADIGITDYYSKDLSLSHLQVEDGRYGIEASGSHLSLDTASIENMSSEALDISGGSDVILKDLVLKNVADSIQVYVDSVADIANLFIDGAESQVLAVYVGSQVRVASSTIRNVSDSSGAVEAFMDSSLDITGLTLDGVSNGEALSVYDTSTMTVRDSFILNTDNGNAIGIYNTSRLTLQNVKMIGGTGDGVNLYTGATAEIQDSVISGFAGGAGIAVYNRSGDPAISLTLRGSEITGNEYGMSLYADNATYAMSSNSIYGNTTYGLEAYGTSSADASGNWWGDASGPYGSGNLSGLGDSIYIKSGISVVFSPWLTDDPFAPDPCAVPGACASNVLFLPGIEGSRLYEGTGCGKSAEEKLWEPLGESLIKILRGAGDKKVKELFLDESGESVCADIYAKADDVIDSVRGSNIYESFIDEMDGLKSDGTITDWKPVAYDWRLSLDDLLAKGAERDGKIYYTEATSTPYIEQTLRALAGGSKTGKVTIVAHSNGGLLAKALLNQLGSSASKLLVDKVIMVGAPQSGAPVDVGALLYGYDQGISSHGIPILHSSVAQQLAENSPMAYHLLPSQSYFDSVMDDALHPVARVAGDAYARELADYGNAIGTATELASFIRASSLNSALIDYASGAHAALDSWAPPEGIVVSQIAGWGVDTVAGIDFYTLNRNVGALAAATPVRMYRPIFVEDGDGTVPVPSALMMASSTSVKRYWVDLNKFNREQSEDKKHRDLFEIPSLEDFIKGIITNSTATLPAYISAAQPSPTTDKKTLTFYLHSPLTLELTDSAGNVTGLAEDGSVGQDIPGSTYGEFGEVKYVTVPEGSYELTLHGQESGTFSLDIQESVGGVVIASSTIANVPTTDQTLASLSISGGLATVTPLTVDSDGDGEADISLAPRAGETVSYEPPAEPEPEPAPVATRAPSGAARGADSPQLQVATPAPAPVQIVPDIATTPLIASATPAVTTPAVVSVPARQPAPAAVRAAKLPTVPAVASLIPDLSQAASVYNASQQLVLKKLGAAVYTNLQRIWRGLKRIF